MKTTHAEAACEALPSATKRTWLMMCATPLPMRTSGRMICAIELFAPATKMPVSFLMKCSGSPAADTAVVELVICVEYSVVPLMY